HEGTHLPFAKSLLKLRACSAWINLQVWRPLEAGRKVSGFRTGVFQDKPKMQTARIQVNAVSKNQDQEDRQNEGDQVAAGVAQDLKGLFSREGHQSAQGVWQFHTGS